MHSSNLPSELTSFIGRRRELAEIKRLLTTTRLLTLTGCGGSGKTRLALRAAGEMARNFPDGVWLVGLASIHDPSLVTQAVFGALGLQDVSARWALSALSDHLKGKRALLVLDNCEHLLDSAAVLAGALLTSCPDLRIVATSRRALGMAGETRLEVPPLSLPDSDAAPRPAQVAGSDAVALLVERAAASRSAFAVTAANAAGVLELCHRLDGLPLALELAAVRLASLTVDQLLAGLDRELATMELRGGDPRLRTMEATLDWSYKLLDEREQRLWARMSVFVGGCTAEAAVAVCSEPESTTADIIGGLASLVESSIIRLDDSCTPERYSMLEPIRIYGEAKLVELGEDTTARDRHCAWVAAFAARVMRFGEDESAGFVLILRERDNVWSAMQFCRRQPGRESTAVDVVATLANYWLARGPLAEARRYLESLLPATTSEPLLRVRCLTICAIFAAALADEVSAEAYALEAMQIAQDLGNREFTAWAAGSLLFARFAAGRGDEVDALSSLMIETGRSLGVPAMVAVGIHHTCSIWLANGRFDPALALLQEGLEICAQAKDVYVRGMLLNNLAEARRRRSELQQAEALAREGIAYKSALDDRRGVASLIETLAWVAADRRQDVRAAELLGCSEGLRESLGVPLLAPYASRHDECLTSSRGRLGQTAFEASFVKGLNLTVAESVSFALGQAQDKPSPAAPRDRDPLTRRETEIAQLIAQGLTNREIATRLFLSARTVDTHVTNMLNKLGLNSRTQLARWVG
ncbi:MAG TPA: LuxR C-terminal-related transcriptional regulator [Candidatus Dormibacteraeota bacterium]